MPQADKTRAEAPAEDRYGWRVLSVTALGVMLCFVNASTLTVVLPVVTHDLGASSLQASWVLLSYMLVTTVLIPVFGRLADMIGRRQLYLGGLAVLTFASLACGLAPNVETMLVFRCLQAIGAAAVITNTTALLTDAFTPRQLGMGLGLNATLAAAAQSFGPMLGGAVVQLLGWRAVFLLNLPIGVYALVRARAILRPDHERPKSTERFDLLGAGLAMLWLGSLVYALSMSAPMGWSSAPVLLAVVVAALGFCAFVLVQRLRSDPLIDLALFADRERATAYVSVLLICMGQTSSLLLVALFLQGVQNLDAFQAGLGVAFVPVGMMITAPLTGRLLNRFSALSLSTAGLSLVMLGLLALALLLSPQVGRPTVGLALSLVGVGTGLFLTANNSGIMLSVPARRRGIANAVRSTLQNTGLVVGAALATSIAIAQLPPDGQRAVYEGRLSQASPLDIHHFVSGCRIAFAVLAAICLLGIVLSLMTQRAMRRHRRAAPISPSTPPPSRQP